MIGNIRAAETRITSGIPVTGNIDPDSDWDYFSIAVTGRGTLRASTTGGMNTVGRTYNSGGTELAENNEDGANMNFDI